MALHFQRTLLFAFSKFIFCISIASLTSVHLPPSFLFPVLSPCIILLIHLRVFLLLSALWFSWGTLSKSLWKEPGLSLLSLLSIFYRGYVRKAREKHKQIKSHTLSLSQSVTFVLKILRCAVWSLLSKGKLTARSLAQELSEHIDLLFYSPRGCCPRAVQATHILILLFSKNEATVINTLCKRI